MKKMPLYAHETTLWAFIEGIPTLECCGVFGSQQEALEACGAMNVSEWRDLGYHFTIDPGCFMQQYSDIEPVLTAAGGDEQ